MPWNHSIATFQNHVPTPRSCFIVGASGLVGKCLLEETLNSNAFERVVVLVRRSLGYTGPNKDLLVMHPTRPHGSCTHCRRRGLSRISPPSRPSTRMFCMIADSAFVRWARHEPRPALRYLPHRCLLNIVVCYRTRKNSVRSTLIISQASAG